MGCWFACLRFRAEKRSPASSVETTPCKSRDRLVSRKQLVSVFAPEEKGSPREGDGVRGSVDGELMHEAKFLKSCGALLETPPEFTKESQKINIQNNNQDGMPHNSHFPLHESSCKKLQWDEQLDEAPCSPASRPNQSLLDSTCDISPSRKQQTIKTYSNIVHTSTPVSLSISAETRTNSVRFEVVEDGSGVKSAMDFASKATPQNGNNIHSPSSKYSPYPTPLRLTDEMETPGTVYPGSVENYGFGNNARIRSQYIYPVLDHMMMNNHSHRKVTMEVSHHLGQPGELSEKQVQDISTPAGQQKLQSSLGSVTVDSALPHSENPLYSNDGQIGEAEQAVASSRCPALVVSSLFQRPRPTDQLQGRANCEPAAERRSPASRSPERDRPIIGTVAAHWNSEESARVSPKLWDGNGIPNSTNKYKEDQRVSWHATPFEERLERALSEEKLYPHSKLLNGKPSKLDEEDEERDTATS